MKNRRIRLSNEYGIRFYGMDGFGNVVDDEEMTDEYGGQYQFKREPHGDKPDIHSAYTDRLYQWDAEKHDRCAREVWGNAGQYWDRRTPADIAKFLRGYYGREVRVLALVHYTNAASGYPVWRIDWQYLSA